MAGAQPAGGEGSIPNSPPGIHPAFRWAPTLTSRDAAGRWEERGLQPWSAALWGSACWQALGSVLLWSGAFLQCTFAVWMGKALPVRFDGVFGR